MEALTRWLRALIFTPGDSPATGAQEGNRTPDLRITSALLYRLSYLGKDTILSPEMHAALKG